MVSRAALALGLWDCEFGVEIVRGLTPLGSPVDVLSPLQSGMGKKWGIRKKQ
jgi:hypothetical protein